MNNFDNSQHGSGEQVQGESRQNYHGGNRSTKKHRTSKGYPGGETKEDSSNSMKRNTGGSDSNKTQSRRGANRADNTCSAKDRNRLETFNLSSLRKHKEEGGVDEEQKETMLLNRKERSRSGDKEETKIQVAAKSTGSSD